MTDKQQELIDVIACAILYIKSLYATGLVADGKTSAEDLKRILAILERSDIYPETLFAENNMPYEKNPNGED